MSTLKPRSFFQNISLTTGVKVIQVLIAVVFLPFIVRGMGEERTGILQIVWAIIGFSSLFDLGLGRAVTQLISRKLKAGDTDAIPSIILTTTVAVVVFSFVPLALLSLGAAPVVDFLNVSPHLQQEAYYTVIWLALSLPAMLANACLGGILTSYQRFDYLAGINLFTISGNFILPVFLLQYTQRLDHVVLGMVICRYLANLMKIATIMRCEPRLRQNPPLQWSILRPLFNFGKWVTISNIVGPLSTNLSDRLILANLLTAQVASYYAVPMGVLEKMTIFAWAVIGVMFPAFSGEYHHDRKRCVRLFQKSFALVAAILIIPTLVILFFSKPLLSWWISPSFAEKSYLITSISVVALYLCCLNTVSSSLIQAAERADIVAKLQMVELPLMLGGLYWGISTYGVLAAPFTMLAFYAFDGAILLFFALRLLRQPEAAACQSVSLQHLKEGPTAEVAEQAAL